MIHGKTSIYRPFCYLWNFLKYLVFLQCNHKVTAARDKGYHVLTHTSTKTVAEIRDLCRQHVLQHRLVEDYIMLAIRHGKGIDYYCSEVARPLDPFMMFCYSIAAGKKIAVYLGLVSKRHGFYVVCIVERHGCTLFLCLVNVMDSMQFVFVNVMDFRKDGGLPTEENTTKQTSCLYTSVVISSMS